MKKATFFLMGGGEMEYLSPEYAKIVLSQQAQPFQPSSITKCAGLKKTERHLCFSPVIHTKATTFNILFSAFPRGGET
jgi:hypothetical protein